MGEQRFDLAAKIPPGATKGQFRTVMRALLAERFHLQAHLVPKEFAVFERTVEFRPAADIGELLRRGRL